MELWIAREKNGALYMYFAKPDKLRGGGFYDFLYDECILISKYANFPDVTWENSPKKVRIELVENENK